MNEAEYRKEVDSVARMDREKIVTELLKSIIDLVNHSRVCRFKFKLEIE